MGLIAHRGVERCRESPPGNKRTGDDLHMATEPSLARYYQMSMTQPWLYWWNEEQCLLNPRYLRRALRRVLAFGPLPTNEPFPFMHIIFVRSTQRRRLTNFYRTSYDIHIAPLSMSDIQLGRLWCYRSSTSLEPTPSPITTNSMLLRLDPVESARPSHDGRCACRSG
jgi:hypothetical protein